jgi:hypothetical protein
MVDTQGFGKILTGEKAVVVFTDPGGVACKQATNTDSGRTSIRKLARVKFYIVAKRARAADLPRKSSGEWIVFYRRKSEIEKYPEEPGRIKSACLLAPTF